MTAPAHGAATARELRTLRLRVTALITLLALAIVVIFSIFAIGLDRQLRDEQIDADLLRETTRAAGLLGFVDGRLDLEAEEVGILGDEVLVGVRPEFDLLDIAEDGDLWDQPPAMSDDEAEERMEAVLADLDPDALAETLGLEEPLDDVELMRERVREEAEDELFDEAYRGFLFDVAEDEGLELTTMQILRTSEHPLNEELAREAVEVVADDGVTDAFTLAEEGLLIRGVPLRSGAEVRGAVLAVADPTAGDADHAAFRRTILTLGVLLVGFAAAAAWFVAGRTIRPAARALAQQERFLADAAHELRTPIAAIRATAEAGESQDEAAALQRVSELAGGAARLTDDLLTLARMDADRLTLQKEPIRLDLLVEALIDDDPAFTFEANQAVIVEADPRLVERAVDNLLRNARLHGGASEAAPARVTVETSGRVVVMDRGPGIPHALLTTLFDRFRSGAASTGHGLGLPLTRWIARAHGGDCTAASGSTGGARFDVWFSPN